VAKSQGDGFTLGAQRIFNRRVRVIENDGPLHVIVAQKVMKGLALKQHEIRTVAMQCDDVQPLLARERQVRIKTRRQPIVGICVGMCMRGARPMRSQALPVRAP
jgi:hypothetical protein